MLDTTVYPAIAVGSHDDRGDDPGRRLMSRSPLSTKLGLALACVLFGLTYYPTFAALVECWRTNDMYSYGFLVPVISGYLVWMRRARLKSIPRIPNAGVGTLVFSCGLAMLVAGQLSQTVLLDELSLIVTLCGATLLIFGTRVVHAVAFPMAYLLAMVPFWDFLTSRIHPLFQLYSAAFGVSVLQMLGIPVLANGTFIVLPNVTLEVAQVCSGVNNLIAVLCVGVPLAYWFVRGWGKRLFIVAASVLIALLSNGVRVAIVSILAYRGMLGPNGDVHGPYSLLRALAIAGVGYMVLFWLIARFADGNGGMAYATPKETAPSAAGPAFVSRRASAIAIAVMVLVLGFDRWHVVTAVPLRANLVAFPNVIGSWQSRAEGTFSSDFGRVDFDHALSRNYANADGAELNLFIGYFEHQQQGRELSGAAVRAVLSNQQRLVNNVRTEGDPRLTEFVAANGPDTYHVVYWYSVNGQLASGDLTAKLHTAWNSLVHGKSNGAIVVVKAKMRRDETLESSRQRTRDFVDGLLPASKDYLAVSGNLTPSNLQSLR